MCYYFIIELIPDRCEHGEISKRQDLWSWICNKFLKTVKTTVLGMRLQFGFSTKLKEKEQKKTPR